SLLGDLAPGSSVLLRDLHADPYRALALSPERGQDPMGVAGAVDRLRRELPHLRLAAFLRPLMRVPHVP
ncbi:MAG: hypothetical protein AAB295_04865, partial [Chloroflexota bacterium]